MNYTVFNGYGYGYGRVPSVVLTLSDFKLSGLQEPDLNNYYYPRHYVTGKPSPSALQETNIQRCSKVTSRLWLEVHEDEPESKVSPLLGGS